MSFVHEGNALSSEALEDCEDDDDEEEEEEEEKDEGGEIDEMFFLIF